MNRDPNIASLGDAAPGAGRSQQPEPARRSFNLSAWALEHRSFTVFLLLLILIFGVGSYQKLARSEDPPFTFKIMVVRTYWPGATASQVQQEVTDRIARKLQESPDVDYMKSYSHPGESTIFFNIKDRVPTSKVADAWYQVRKKVGDMKVMLPPDVQGPFFNDEFGDVYTNMYAFMGDGYTPAQLHDYAERLRAELLRVPDIAKVDYFGDPEQRVRVEISNAQLAKLGLTPQQIALTLNEQNSNAGSGAFTTANDQVYVRATGQYADANAIANTLLRVNGRTIRLGDIAQISRGYADPPSDTMRFDGQNVLGVGVTMAPSGDVIELGKALKAKTQALQASLPAGLKLVEVASMPQSVAHSVSDFVEAVVEAIAIVLVVSLITLGFRTGMVVVVSLPLVLAGTALCMYAFHVGLHKVSLGTLILALGLMVDDAIIAIETMVVKLEQGLEKARAAVFAFDSTAMPMLTGTLVTVAGFLPIALAESATGEYTRSIFQVSAIALTLSWLSSFVVIPLLGARILSEHPGAKHSTPGQSTQGHHGSEDVYDTAFYRRFRGWVAWCIDHRTVVLLGTLGAFVVGLVAFSTVPRQFFPSSDRPEILVDLRLKEGSSFEATQREVKRLEAAIAKDPAIDHYIDFVGAGAPRFYLPLDQQLTNSNFAQFVITAKGIHEREELAGRLETTLHTQFAGLRTRITRLESGPPVGFPLQFRVSGPEIGAVHEVAEQVAKVVRANAGATHVQLDWDEPGERSVRFEVDQNKARQLGVSSQDIENYLQMTLSGIPMTQLRERDKLIAVELRASKGDRLDPSQIERFAIPTPSGASIPLASLGRFTYGVENAVIWERDRQPTIIVQADTARGVQPISITNELNQSLASVRAQLPPGYRISTGGSLEENEKGQRSIDAKLLLAAVVILTILMIKLQSFSRMLMVVLTAPLGLIGVAAALLLLHMPFGFVAMLGTIAMFGIIMRNSVILMDQIDQDIKAGHARYEAIVGATMRRFRPIAVSATAAVLGLIPLTRNNFFGPMATALMGGITVATALTIFYLPALYAFWFRVRRDEAPAHTDAPLAVQQEVHV